MTKNLSQLFDIKNKDIISITGAGGKTTLMEKLGEELRKKGRVLITTSTKIRRPSCEKFDYIFDSFKEYKKTDEKNVLIAMGQLNPCNNKFSSLKENEIKEILDDFDYVIIEADGCRNLPLKMWKTYEPVIYDISSKVISVFSAKTIGRKIEEDFIYNYKDFTRVIDEDIVNKDVFLRLLENKPGPFGNFKGQRYVFFNQVDSPEEKLRTEKVLDYLKKNNEQIDYIYGSLLKEEYYEN